MLEVKRNNRSNCKWFLSVSAIMQKIAIPKQMRTLRPKKTEKNANPGSREDRVTARTSESQRKGKKERNGISDSSTPKSRTEAKSRSRRM